MPPPAKLPSVMAGRGEGAITPRQHADEDIGLAHLAQADLGGPIGLAAEVLHVDRALLQAADGGIDSGAVVAQVKRGGTDEDAAGHDRHPVIGGRMGYYGMNPGGVHSAGRRTNQTMNEQVIRDFWAAFDRFAFEAALPLLHKDFIAELPQSGERFRGPHNFIAFNKAYPGKWRCTVVRLIAAGDQVVTETAVSDGTEQFTAISFFTLKDGRILHLREFWPDSMEAQAWRAQWAEQM
jgi:ketosteroid isomerase-like protein